MPKIIRVEIKLPEDVKEQITTDLLPVYGVQQYAIIAALRMFAELPADERQKLVNDEIRNKQEGE